MGIRLFIILLISLVPMWGQSPILSEIVTDTLVLIPEQMTYPLRHQLVPDSTVLVIHRGQVEDNYELNTVQGEITFAEKSQYVPGESVLVSYRYLTVDIPGKIGPGSRDLPRFEELLTQIRHDTTDQNFSAGKITGETSSSLPSSSENLFSSGSIFRSVSVNPLAGADFSGGMRLQLQGKLTEDMTVSGVLTDQSTPIQPEGNTQTLEELDKVFLQVNHPAGNVVAGDVEIHQQHGRFFQVDRKLTGLTGSIRHKQWKAQAVVAGTQGKHHQLEFMGEDQKQGPYYLTSREGSRDIIVLAGTEVVYLEGERLTRGENHDYIIDYSQGELTFNPNRLIHFDSDIFVEYQYSDFQYSRNVMGASVQRTMANKGDVSLAWYREADRFDPELPGFPDSLRSELTTVGDDQWLIPGAVVDAEGDYILEDSIYVYRPDDSDTLKTHYTVSFYNDPEAGSYIRRISVSGKLYYEFVSPDKRTDDLDLYRPVRKIVKPQQHDILQFGSRWSSPELGEIAVEWNVSGLDKNTESGKDDRDNLGQARALTWNGSPISLGEKTELTMGLETWDRQKRFSRIQNDRDINFASDWNIPFNQDAQAEKLANLHLGLNHQDRGKTQLAWWRYDQGSDRRHRMEWTTNVQGNWIHNWSSRINRVINKEKVFFQVKEAIQLLPGNIHPRVRYNQELALYDYKFEQTGIGVAGVWRQEQFSLDVSSRTDWQDHPADSSQWQQSIRSWIGELDWSGRTRNGWYRSIYFRSRWKEDVLTQSKITYYLGRMQLRYRRSTNPLQWSWSVKLEESLAENRALVYDSVGTGLGQYRYDADFNTYVEDPNGAYIAYSVPIGSRTPVTHYEGSQQWRYDFRRSESPILQALYLQLETRSSFQGQKLKSVAFTNPALNDSSIQRSRWMIRTDVDYRPNRSERRIHVQALSRLDANGLDPRGMDVFREQTIGGDWMEPISKQWRFRTEGDLHSLSTESSVSSARDRFSEGWWLESGVIWSDPSFLQVEPLLRYGSDSGIHSEEDFQAILRGLGLETTWFLGKKGRILLNITKANVTLNSMLTTLPPEALQGHATGETTRIQMQGQWLIGQNLSCHFNVSYLDDQRYDQFLSLQGELRAYF